MSSIASAEEAAPAPNPRIVTRLAVELLIDQIRIGRASRRPIDGLLILAIVQTNIAHMLRDDAVLLTYAAPVPDELRRPVSVNALAASLRLPFETVRRRVNDLVAVGVCQTTPSGIYIPQSALGAREDILSVLGVYERLRRFYYELKALGALHGLPAPSRSLDGRPPVMAVARLFGAYILRILDMVNRRVGDMMEALILLAIICINTEGLTAADLDASPGGVLPDERRRPARIGELAERMGMPPETVRRRVSHLLARDRCVRAPRGLIVPARVMMEPDTVAVLREHVPELQRLFVRLAQLGVLELWDELATQTPPP